MMKECSVPLHARGIPLHARGSGVPDFEFPNSEFRMAYGPVHKLWARFINGRVGHAMSYG